MKLHTVLVILVLVIVNRVYSIRCGWLSSPEQLCWELYMFCLVLFSGKYLSDVEPLESLEVSNVWKMLQDLTDWHTACVHCCNDHSDDCSWKVSTVVWPCREYYCKLWNFWYRCNFCADRSDVRSIARRAYWIGSNASVVICLKWYVK